MAQGQVFTQGGKDLAVNQLDRNTAVAGASVTYFLAWGAGGTTPAVADTALETENAEARVAIDAGDMSQPLTDQVQWTETMTATGTRTVQEVGILSASTAGTLYAHIVHGSLALESGDTVDYTIRLLVNDTSE